MHYPTIPNLLCREDTLTEGCFVPSPFPFSGERTAEVETLPTLGHSEGSFAFRGAFSIELLLSSGPRKDPEEYRRDAACRESGEDAGGVFFFPGGCLFWIADGTSQEPSFPPFSSRTLARDFGTCLRESIHRKFPGVHGPITLSPILSDAFELLRCLWEERVGHLPDTPDSDGTHEEFLASFARCADGIRRMSWSSTLLAGLVSFESGLLEIANYGDSGGIVYRHEGGSAVIEPNRKRCSLLLEEKADGNSPAVTAVIPSDHPLTVLNSSSVDRFFCMTDGIFTASLERFLTQVRSRPSFSVEDMFRNLRTLSGDDKTLLVGRFSGEE